MKTFHTQPNGVRTMCSPASLLALLTLPLLNLATEASLESSAVASLGSKAVSTFETMLRGGAAGQASYTQNAACLPQYCMNPIIPGLMLLGENVLEKNKQQPWTCANIDNTKSLFKLGSFCSRVIAAYPFSIPKAAPNSDATEAGQIQKQSYLALQTYVGHLAGMGFDFWDHTTPWDEDDECIKSVWRMSCYTYFPRCNVISPGEYLAPCRSSCEGYLSKCRVQCCDEGVQCAFTHAKKTADGQTVYDHGYPDHQGPSPLCTRGSSRPVAAVVGMLIALLTVSRQ